MYGAIFKPLRVAGIVRNHVTGDGRFSVYVKIKVATLSTYGNVKKI
jgi:hypothetical protein